MGLLDFFKRGKKGKESPQTEREPTMREKMLLAGRVSWSVWPMELEAGTVADMLATELDYANQRGLMVVMYIYADWAPAAEAFKRLRNTDPVAEALKEAHVVEVQCETMHRMAEIDWEAKYIPQFFPVSKYGKQLSRNIVTSDQWGPDTPENIGRVMGEWIRELKEEELYL